MSGNGEKLSWELYLNYLKEWADSHKGMKFFGMSPACYQEWLDNEIENVYGDSEDGSESEGVIDPDIEMEV